MPRLLIIYPAASLDCNQTMTFLLQTLAQRDVEVDVLLGQSSAFEIPAGWGNNIHLEFVPWQFLWEPQPSLDLLPRRIARALISPRRSLCSERTAAEALSPLGYSLILGVDPHGVVLADYLNRWARCPLVYVSFEVIPATGLTSEEDKSLLAREVVARAHTDLLLIQDEERLQLFCRDHPVPRDRVALVPVAPPPQEVTKTDYLRQTLGIPPHQRIVLYCGNFSSWASPEEVVRMVSTWPDQFCLVIHNRTKKTTEKEDNSDDAIQDLPRADRLYYTEQPVGRDELPRLVASADFGLAVYRPSSNHWTQGDNLYHLGLSSGKVSLYALCGLPILASALPVYEREFARYRCGKTFRHAAETAALLQEMDREYGRYQEGTQQFYWERLNPVPGMDQFCHRLLSLAHKATDDLGARWGQFILGSEELWDRVGPLQAQFNELNKFQARYGHLTYFGGILRELPRAAGRALLRRLHRLLHSPRGR